MRRRYGGKARIVVAAALLGVLASAVPAGAAPTAKGPKPTVTDFTATPTTLYDNGGMVTLSAVVSNATNCILSSKPAVKGLPAKIACSNGVVTEGLVLPVNTGKKPVVHTFVLQVTGTKKVKAKPVTVTVETTAPPYLPGVRSIVGNGQSDCAVLASGAVACWGYNDVGELGNGSVYGPDGNNGYDTPQYVTGLSGASAVTSGGPSDGLTDGGSYCALLTAGSVDCWGDNTFGDLGNGVTGGPDGADGYDTPQPVSGLTGVTSVVSDGIDGYCALLGSGAVDCWGSDEVGQLGNGTVTVPDGSGDSLGFDTPQGVPGVSGALALASDGYGYCALLSSGGIDCWGSNGNGDLGNGTIGGPDGQNGYDSPQVVSGVTDASSVVSGPGGYCAELSGGAVDCWGNNSDGELGVGKIGGPVSCLTGNDCYDAPQPVTGVTGATAVTNIGIGYCVTLTSGGVDCWGYNEDGQIGNGTIGGTDGDYGYASPQPVTGISDAAGIAPYGGGSSTCVDLTTGAVECWGLNMSGILGNGTIDGPDGKFGYDVPQAVTGVDSATAVTGADGNGYCAVTADGYAQCWGANSYGELGIGELGGPDGAGGFDSPQSVVGPGSN